MSSERRKTILVVDDESHICLMMEDLLMDEYEVLTAKDGVEALEIVSEKQDMLDLVITDIRMPRMDGMELLKEIKTHYPDIGVMMISAHGNIRTAVEAMQQGAYGYISKPLPEFDELDITISRYFEKRELEEQIRQQERAEMERIYRELKDARHIQQSLLPGKPPEIEGFEIAAASIPAKEVGGDFYDYLSLGDNIGIVLADISGKSVKAAMVAAMANGMLHTEIKGQRELWNSPRMILRELNVALGSRLVQEMFTAMSLGILQTRERRFLFSNAGLPYPIVKRREKIWELEVNGIPLGLIDSAEYSELSEYTELSVDMEAGDFVVFYSDGISEATDRAEEMYETKRLMEVIRQADPGLSAQGMVDWIIRDVTGFVGDVDPSDDITLVVLRCNSARAKRNEIRRSTSTTTVHGWVIQPSFKHDVFHFLWSISESCPTSNRWYREEMAQWRAKLPADILKKLDEVTHWDTSRISQSLIGTVFNTIEAHTIDEIIQATKDDEIMEDARRKTGMLPPQEPHRAKLLEVLRSIQVAGFEEYWRKDIKPIVQQQCDELLNFLRAYPTDRLIAAVNEFVKPDEPFHMPTLYVYLTYFSYALCYRLSEDAQVQSFQPGKPINTRQFVRVAIHEVLHGFRSTPALDNYYQTLSENDAFFAATLPKLRIWGEGGWENIIEAGEAYLSDKLRVYTFEELMEHLRRNYNGALVLAQVIYHHLLAREAELASLGYNDFLVKLFEEDIISSGNLEKQYRTVVAIA